MKNPGLSVFAAPTTFIRSPNHPLNIDPLEDDPDLESGDNDSDYVPPVNFGRWRTPGQSVHVPVHQGPTFGPGHSPEDVIHGEVVSRAEQDSADKIINGEHESDSPSGNPYVERAREDLHTPDSAVAVSTLAKLLSGAHPQTMSREAMEAAHHWLSHRFTGVRVNPGHGMLEAASPAGSQLVRRHQHLPAIPEERESEPPTYSLVNKHGTFESRDPERLVRTMVAFQIVHNELAKKKKDDDDQDDNGLSVSSGFKGRMEDFLFDLFHPSGDEYSEHKSGTPGQWGQHRLKPVAPAMTVPPSAVFEPNHNGTDTDDHGQRGGYVMDASLAPLDWLRHEGTAYSPGHPMRFMLDPHEAGKPRSDPKFPGHTFTYAPNLGTGHTEARVRGGINYWVQDKIHPAARGAGFDLPAVPKPPKTPPAGRVPKRGPQTQPHNPPLSLPPAPGTPITIRRPPKTSAAASNDLCPVCASGYLEPYDSEFHECLNCGSLVKHVGFEKHADDMTRRPSRPRGGLGRGLTGLDAIPEQVGDPLNLAAGGSEDPEYVVGDDGSLHPLADEELNPDYQGYTAPRSILGATPSRETDELDEHMGKLGLQPHHKPGQSRMYMMQMPGTPGGYLRLTEGVPTAAGEPSGWALTADHIIPRSDQWTMGEDSKRHIVVDRMGTKPGQDKPFKQPLPDLGDRQMAQKTFLAGGSHPTQDPVLYHAIKDVAENGRNSHTYWNAFNGTAYEPPSPHPTGTTQRELRGLSSVGNPGLSRFLD